MSDRLSEGCGWISAHVNIMDGSVIGGRVTEDGTIVVDVRMGTTYSFVCFSPAAWNKFRDVASDLHWHSVNSDPGHKKAEYAEVVTAVRLDSERIERDQRGESDD